MEKNRTESSVRDIPAASAVSASFLDEADDVLLSLLKGALNGEKTDIHRELSAEEWGELLDRADRHAVLSLLYDTLTEMPLTEAGRQFVERVSRKVVLQNYRLSFCTHQIETMLREKGITAVILKGVTAAANYPTPELRKSGDIDILIPYPQQIPLAKEALICAGLKVAEEQLANHHLVMHYEDGIELELHTMLAEPFDNAKINGYLDSRLSDIPDHMEKRNVIGYDYTVLSDGYQAYQLLLHMLQHFLRAGFGLKLLCDWFYFWSRQVAEEEVELYLKLVKESGISGFSMMITSLCVSCLGLDRECALCRRMDGLLGEDDVAGFMKDILEAEEFGKSAKDRMVTLRGTRIWDYVREFHHITCLNFPKASKVFLFWPVLWCVTLFRFLYNNRRYKRGTARDIIKKAGKRSERMEKLELFRVHGNIDKNKDKDKDKT